MADQPKIVISAVDNTRAAFSSVKTGLGQIEGVGTTLNGVIGRLAPLLGAATFTAFVKGGIDTLDMLGDLSTRTGVAASTLSGFQAVATLSDTSLEALGKGLNKLSVYMAENSEAAAKLGLTAKDPAEAFVQLSGIISGIEDTQQRAALASKILGKSYEELLPALLQGSDAMREQIAAGQAMAGVTDENVRKAGEFNDQLDLLKLKTSSVGVEIASKLLPSLNEIATNFIENNKRGGLFLATLAAIGNAVKIAAVGTDQDNLEKRQLDLLERLGVAEKRYAEISAQSNKASRENARRNLINMRKELADVTAQLESNNVKNNPVDNSPKTNMAAVNDFVGSGKKAAAKSLDNPYAKEYAQDIASLMQAFQQLEAPAQSVTDKLQTQLDAYTNLDPAVRTYLQGLLDQANATDEFAAAIERNSSMMEITLQYEQAAAAQSKTISDSYDAILRETEDLNIALISDDKERAKAQLEIEHNRRMERIAMMEGEQEDIALLLDAENDRFAAAQRTLAAEASRSNGYMKDLGATFSSAFEDANAGGKEFSDVLAGLGQDIERILNRKMITDPLMKGLESFVIDPLSQAFGGLFANADGGVYSGAGISAYSGQIVSSPTVFPFAKGIGLMGEAGPEAIMPLRRGADGKLGVSGGGNNVTVNVFEAPGTKTNVQQEQGADGQLNIKVVVEQLYGMMGRDISRGTGLAPMIERRYGLNRVAGGA